MQSWHHSYHLKQHQKVVNSSSFGQTPAAVKKTTRLWTNGCCEKALPKTIHGYVAQKTGYGTYGTDWIHGKTYHGFDGTHARSRYEFDGKHARSGYEFDGTHARSGYEFDGTYARSGHDGTNRTHGKQS